jgi:predicted metal-dependent HD superfamily phosphohydrolase
MNYQQVIKQAEEFATNYMKKHKTPALLFHDLSYTKKTVAVADQIARHYKLNEKEFFIVTIAAWFLNLGYYKNVSQPQLASAELAEEFLKNSGIEYETINYISRCIFITKNPQNANTLLEKIICDADSFYLGVENFSECNKSKRKEFELLNNTDIPKNEWRKNTIQLLQSHQYYNDYSKEHFNDNKIANLQKLKKKQEEIMTPVNPVTSVIETKTDMAEKSEKKIRKGKSKDDPGKTIETMFRTTSTNSQRLSNQADAKAHILISVNAIVISIFLSLVVRKMGEYDSLTIPVVMLLVVNLSTIIFSILATRPNVPKGVFREKDIEDNKVNLLFFGNFFKMDFDYYSQSMLNAMEDKKVLYLHLLKNLHEQGIVLNKKYKLLKTAYNIFMYGLIVSVVTFVVASWFF